MKNVWILLVSICLTACMPKDIRKALKSEKYTYKNGSYHFDSNSLTMDLLINGKSVRFLFDTGANRVILNKPDILSDVSQSYKIGSLTLADGSLADFVMKSINYEDPFTNIENHLISVNNPPENECRKITNFDGIVGWTNQIKGERGFEISFSQNRISSFDPSEIYQRKKGDYVEVPIKILYGMVHLGITINGKVYYHLMDTGNSFGLIWPRKYEFTEELKNSYKINGTIAASLNDVIDTDYVLMGESSVKMGNITTQSLVMETKDVPRLNAGIQFLRKFDWLFDFKNKKAYARPIEFNPTLDFRNRIGFQSRQGELKVVSVSEGIDKLKVGDVVSAINGQTITAENICDWMATLNSAKSYDDYQFVTKS